MKFYRQAAATVFLALPALAQQPITITCASQANGQQQSCPANTRDGVLLAREQSANVCRQGSTWTYDRRGITVSGGCSADFLVSGRGSRGANSSNGYGDNGYNSPEANAAGNNSYNNGQQGSYGNGQQGNYTNGRQGSSETQRSLTPLPQGTQLAMQLDRTVRISDLNQGDFVTGTLASDVSANGHVVAPAGTPVQAKVFSVTGASLDLRLDSFHLNDQTYSLQTTAVHGIRDAVTQTDSGARTSFGSVLGSLANAGSLPAGTVFNFRLTATARPTSGN